MFKALLISRFQAILYSMFLAKKENKPSTAGKKILIGLLAVYVVGAVAALMGLMFYGLSPLIALEDGWLYFALAATVAFVLCFVGSVFITQSQLFEATDNELLLSMPIPPSMILMSRMLVLLLINLVYELMVLIPALVVYGMYRPLTGSQIALFVLSALVFPLLIMAVTCLFSYLFAFLLARVKRRNMIQIALYFLFFFAYLYVYFNLQNYLTQLVENGDVIADAYRKALPPFYYFGKTLSGSWLDGLFLVLWSALPMGLILFLLAKGFANVTLKKTAGKRSVYRRGALKVSSPRLALMKRELGRYFAIPMYFFNCGLGVVMKGILGVVLLLKGKEWLPFLESVPFLKDALAPLFALTLCFCCTMECLTAPSISLEGKNLWIIKSAPVSEETFLRSKLEAALALGLPSLVFAWGCGFVLPMNLYDRIIALLLSAGVLLCLNIFGLLMNLYFPRLDWVSEVIVIKQSGSVIATVFGGMGLVVALAGIHFLLPGVSYSAYMTGALVITLLLAAGLWLLTVKEGKKRYAAL